MSTLYKCECETSGSPLLKLFHLLHHSFFVGFLLGLYTHNNSNCTSQLHQDISGHSVYSYIIGAYFTIHLFSWFVVFAFFYRNVLSIGFAFFLSFFDLGIRKTALYLFIIETIFGYWTAEEILGGWCDLEHIKECIQGSVDTEAICESTVIKGLTIGVQSVCYIFAKFPPRKDSSHHLCTYTT